MATLFYILVIVQIALGIYSLWNGFEWFRMVRRRLTSHAGFYAPITALICPCKGNERGLEENLTALTRFEYANYEIYFTLATSLDPALKIIERVKAASSKPVHIVIAGPPEDCSEKVFNLRRTVEALPANFEVLVFTDSDVRLPRGWLAKLVAPLQDVRIGATTAYRWIIPSGQLGAGGFSSALASAWNAAIATMLGKQSENFCWGGGTAIRRKTFDDVKVLEEWKGAVSDDFAMTDALEAGKPIVFCPECLAATLHPWTGTQPARIYKPANDNHPRLFAAPLASRRDCARRLFAHVDLCVSIHLQHDGRRRSVDAARADHHGGSATGRAERRDSHDRGERIAA